MWCDLLWTLPPPHNTNNTCKLHMCSMLHAPRGWQSTCLCMCTKFAYKFLGGSCRGHSWIKMRIHSKLMSLLRFAPPRPTCPTRTLARSLCKQELKLLVCNTHPQASPCGERLMLSVVHFLRKCRQMTSHHVELMCGATPLSFTVHFQTTYYQIKPILPTFAQYMLLHINIHVIYMFFYML